MGAALVIPGLHTEIRWVAATRARLVAIRGGHFSAIGTCRLRAHVKVSPPKEQGKEDQKHQYVRGETLTCKKASSPECRASSNSASSTRQ